MRRKLTGDQSSKAVGIRYEKQAAEFLKEKGYRILEQNYRCKKGEIDIIAKDEEYLCFIEVKFRDDPDMTKALGAVNAGKQRKISGAALYYLMEKGYLDDTPCRFDVLGITPKGMQLVRNAFEWKR